MDGANGLLIAVPDVFDQPAFAPFRPVSPPARIGPTEGAEIASLPSLPGWPFAQDVTPDSVDESNMQVLGISLRWEQGRGDLMGQSLITPSKVTAWLECPHYLTLERRVAAKLLRVEKSNLGDFARLVMAKGLQHEQECLDRYRQEGRNILIVEAQGDRTFRQWVDDVGNPFTGKHDDVVYQMPFIHDGIQGI